MGTGSITGYEACPGCQAEGRDNDGNNLTRYEDGGGYCHACGHTERSGDRAGTEGSGSPRDAGVRRGWSPIEGHYQDIPARGLTEADCRHWGYQVGTSEYGVPIHIMNYRNADKSPFGQKYRTPDKQFSWEASSKEHPLYGIWLWSSKGKSVVITEGELDAISVSKAFGHKWPVVSLPDGTGSVKKCLPRAYEWLDGYEQICLWFDDDEKGREALAQAVELLPPGKVWIIRSPEGCKDASDTLVNKGVGAVTKAFWDKALHRPDGIKSGREFTYSKVMVGIPPGIPFPWPKLQEMTYGLREAEITMLTAGSGMGKSTLARELAYYLTTEHHRRIGNIFLEEPNSKTVQAYAALHCGVPAGVLRNNPSLITEAQFNAAMEAAVWDKMEFYDHFGSVASDNLIQKIGYFRRALGCHFVVLDHVSIVTSGLESGSEGERKDIDILMTRLAQITQQTGVGVIAIVHLKRKPGVSFNEGGQVSLNDLRGSAALEQLSFNVYALERDQQAEDETEKHTARIRVLKCRESGDTGEADLLRYDRDTGRLRLASAFETKPKIIAATSLNGLDHSLLRAEMMKPF